MYTKQQLYGGAGQERMNQIGVLIRERVTELFQSYYPQYPQETVETTITIMIDTFNYTKASIAYIPHNYITEAMTQCIEGYCNPGALIIIRACINYVFSKIIKEIIPDIEVIDELVRDIEEVPAIEDESGGEEAAALAQERMDLFSDFAKKLYLEIKYVRIWKERCEQGREQELECKEPVLRRSARLAAIHQKEWDEAALDMATEIEEA